MIYLSIFLSLDFHLFYLFVLLSISHNLSHPQIDHQDVIPWGGDTGVRQVVTLKPQFLEKKNLLKKKTFEKNLFQKVPVPAMARGGFGGLGVRNI